MKICRHETHNTPWIMCSWSLILIHLPKQTTQESDRYATIPWFWGQVQMLLTWLKGCYLYLQPWVQSVITICCLNIKVLKDGIFEEHIWDRKENSNNNGGSNNAIIINDRRKHIHVEAETLSCIRTSLPIKRSNCKGWRFSDNLP